MRAIKCEHKDGSMPATSEDKLTICDKLFNSSLIMKVINCACLKCGSSPTMNLSNFNMNKEGHYETQGLHWIAGLKDDLDIFNECDSKIRVNEVTPSHHVERASIISREERSKKVLQKLKLGN